MIDLKRFTILHTIESGGPGGAETVLLYLATRLDPRLFRSVVLLPREGWLTQELEKCGVKPLFVKSKAWYDFRLPRAIRSLITREEVDLIHSHLPDQNFYSCLSACLTRCKVVVTYHGSVGLFPQSRLRGAVKPWVVRSCADAIVGVSDSLIPVLTKYGLPARKMVRIYNGIEPNRFSAKVETDLRRELAWPQETKLIGMVANIRKPKGYEYFVRAARRISDVAPATKFLAVGDVDENIGGPLRELVRNLGLEDRFVFLGFRSDIPGILSDLDVFVLSSVNEGFSIATIEAMGAGKPVVVTRSGGPEEIVTDGRTGFLVPPADADGLAARVCDVLRDPELAARLGEAARADVQSRFSIDKMVKEYESLYLRCLNAP